MGYLWVACRYWLKLVGACVSKSNLSHLWPGEKLHDAKESPRRPPQANSWGIPPYNFESTCYIDASWSDRAEGGPPHPLAKAEAVPDRYKDECNATLQWNRGYLSC
jgi:hypothetical protein